MACVILGKDSRQWFAELHLDLEKIQGPITYEALAPKDIVF